MPVIGKKMVISVLFDTVSVKLICCDDYEAQVVYDDISQRLLSGEEITFGIDPKNVGRIDHG